MTKERAAQLLPLIDSLVSVPGAAASLFYGSQCILVIYPPDSTQSMTFYDGEAPFNTSEAYVFCDPGLKKAEECMKRIIGGNKNVCT